MRRRDFLGVVLCGLGSMAGCTTVPTGIDSPTHGPADTPTGTPTRTDSGPPQYSPTRSGVTGDVRNQVITQARVLFHEAHHPSGTESGQWVIEVRLEVFPHTGERITPASTGVRVLFLDEAGDAVFEAVTSVPPNTSNTSRVVTRTVTFDPEAARADGFAAYRIILEHA